MGLKGLKTILLTSLLSSSLFAGFDSMNPLQSSSHTSNTASQNEQVTLTWNQAIANGGDNLGGYYYILDQNENTLIPTVIETRSTLGMSATSITVTAPDEGTFHFHLAPYADSGNIGATLHFKFIKIDTSAPTELSISPDGGSFNSVQTISISATDANNFTIYYTTDDSSPTVSSTTYSAPFSVSSSQTIKSIAIDSAGNSSPIASAIFTISNTSNVAQFGNEVTAESTIATKNTAGSSSFVPTISVEGASVTEYKFKIDTTSYSAQIAKTTPIDISGLQDGRHTISIVGFDGTSLQLESEATELSFIVDNTAPDNVIFSTPSGTTITTDTTITMSSDNSADIYYTTDGSVPDKTSIKSSTVALSSTNNGTFTLRAISYDTASNKSSIQEAIYTVNITAPTNDGGSSSSGGSSSGGNTPTNDDDNPTDNTDNNITIDDNNTTDNTDNNITIDDNNTTDNTDNNITIDDNNTTDNTDNNITIDDNNITDNTDNNITVDDNNRTDNTDNNIDDGSTSDGGSTSSINLPFTNDNGNKESVNINSDIKNTTQTTNSDGTVTVTASTSSVKNELQVNTDGTLNSTTTIGSATTSSIEVNTVGADTQFNADGSLTISSTVSNTAGSSISSNVEIKANGEMINTLNITVKNGTSTQSVIKSDIEGTDTIIADDGSMTMTTPTITTAKNQKVNFEIVLNVLGEVTPTLSIDGTDVPLPQFEAGSTVSIKKELNKILLTIETLLTQKLTFN